MKFAFFPSEFTKLTGVFELNLQNCLFAMIYRVCYKYCRKEELSWLLLGKDLKK